MTILVSLVPQVEQVPWMAGRPLAMVIVLGSFISFWLRHLTQ